jgi:hypothetical protein
VATRLNMSSKKINYSVIAFLLCIFISGCNSSNRHVWTLPNNEKIEYHEGPIDDPGFQAKSPEYVRWISEKRGTHNSNVGSGGGYKSLTLHLNQNQTLAWITGRYADAERQFYVAVLDMKTFQIVDGDCMWESESNMNPSDIKLKHEVEQSSATATVIEEQK